MDKGLYLGHGHITSELETNSIGHPVLPVVVSKSILVSGIQIGNWIVPKLLRSLAQPLY